MGRLWQLGKRFIFKITGKQREKKTTSNLTADFTLQHSLHGLPCWIENLLQPVDRGSDAEGDAGPQPDKNHLTLMATVAGTNHLLDAGTYSWT